MGVLFFVLRGRVCDEDIGGCDCDGGEGGGGADDGGCAVVDLGNWGCFHFGVVEGLGFGMGIIEVYYMCGFKRFGVGGKGIPFCESDVVFGLPFSWHSGLMLDGVRSLRWLGVLRWSSLPLELGNIYSISSAYMF